MELKEDKGVELELDLTFDEEEYKSIIEKLIIDFRNAEIEALFKGIRANAIVLNSEYDYCKEFYFFMAGRFCETRPMLMGKHLYLERLPKEYKFVMLEKQEPIDYEKLIKKYVRVVKGKLVFKNISFKRNKKDYEEISRLVE